MNEIIIKVLISVISFIATGVLGYFTAKIRSYKEKDLAQEEALKCLLRSSITKIYYKYIKQGSIPQYEKENVTYLHAQYKKMNGNSYVDELYPEIMKLPIEK